MIPAILAFILGFAIYSNFKLAHLQDIESRGCELIEETNQVFCPDEVTK